MITFSAIGHHCPLAGTNLYCLVTGAHWCEQLAEGCYPTVQWPGVKLLTIKSQVQNAVTTRQLSHTDRRAAYEFIHY